VLGAICTRIFCELLVVFLVFNPNSKTFADSRSLDHARKSDAVPFLRFVHDEYCGIKPFPADGNRAVSSSCQSIKPDIHHFHCLFGLGWARARTFWSGCKKVVDSTADCCRGRLCVSHSVLLTYF